MSDDSSQPLPQVEPARLGADYESTPITRGEYIAAVVHLYRGELYRANSWRIRLDNTTNWAVLTTAGLLTFTFGETGHSHWTLLIGMAMIAAFLFLEARRFRYADVWRNRVRLIEENFYGPILRRDPVSPEREWGKLIAGDLFEPTFKISRVQAVRARFTRNYWFLFLVLLGAWGVRIGTGTPPPRSWAMLRGNLAQGMLLPWWMPVVYVSAFLIGVVFLLVFTKPMTDPGAAHRAVREMGRKPDL